MRAKSAVLGALLVFAGASPVIADVDWGGPGFYIGDDVNDMFGGFIAGPFSTQADCTNALEALSQDERQYATCDYFSSDPDAGNGQN